MRKHLYFIIYLFIILISISCTQDELLDTPEEGVSENQESNQGIQVQRLSKETFSLHSEVSTTIKEYVSNQKATRSIDQNAFTILEDEVVFIDNIENGYRSYTFQVITNEQEEGFQNLVLVSKDDGTYESYIVNYPATYFESINTSNEDDHIPEPVTYYEIDFNDSELLNLTTRNFTQRLLTACTTTFYYTTDGNGFGFPNAQDCQEHNNGQICEVSVHPSIGLGCNENDQPEFEETAPNSGNGNGGIINVNIDIINHGDINGNGIPDSQENNTSTQTTVETPNSGGGGSSNNNGSNSNNNIEILTIPVDILDAILINNLNALLDTPLTDEQEAWIVNSDENTNATDLLLNFLLANDSQDDILFVQNIINQITTIGNLPIFTENDFPGLEENFPFEWWNNENFVNSNISLDVDDEGFSDLNAAEKLLVRLYPEAALAIRFNKDIAINETISRFGTNGRNDRSDSFRHAFFNAMNSNDTLGSIARVFSDAHEFEVPDLLILEKEMDLFNNNVGHTIGEDASIFISDENLSNIVFTAFANGELRFLDPLGPIVPPNFGITNTTILIPTF